MPFYLNSNSYFPWLFLESWK